MSAAHNPWYLSRAEKLVGTRAACDTSAWYRVRLHSPSATASPVVLYAGQANSGAVPKYNEYSGTANHDL